MESRGRKPTFQNVVDLGLRDVGIKNQPRRFAAHFAKWILTICALFVASIVALCAVVRWTDVDASIAIPFMVVWPVALVPLAFRAVKRSPPVVVKVTAEGGNQAVWLLIAPLLLLVPVHALIGAPLLIPVTVFTLAMTVILLRARGALPEVLRELRSVLEEGESVLGDGIGMVWRARASRDSFRLIVATDRRLLVVTSTRSKRPFVLVDAPYRRVSWFGIEWQRWGRAGVLSLAVPTLDSSPEETQVIGNIVPANLMSIARALQSHGVPPEDPDAVSEAERGWEEALREAEASERGESPERLIDRASMSTREFDRGLWLLLGLSAVALYLNPFGVGLGVSRDAVVALLLVVPALCIICGYASGTKSSLAYIAPLNLLVSPTFFFADAGEVIWLMIVLSAVAALGLWAGSALRRATTGAAHAPAEVAGRPARGSLRYAVSGLGLIRISVLVLAGMLTLVGVSAAAGFELTSLRLAVDEATVKQLPVDGRSNLTGKAASLTYTPGPNLHEFITDEHWSDDPTDGARWELRSSFTKGYNVVTLASYVFEPRLDDPGAVADFIAGKDDEHSRAAGYRVRHTERVVDGRKGYVWKHPGRDNSWVFAAWFPAPEQSVRLECVVRGQEQFRRLCAEAFGSLKFR